jgi:hypothetical protein
MVYTSPIKVLGSVDLLFLVVKRNGKLRYPQLLSIRRCGKRASTSYNPEKGIGISKEPQCLPFIS